MDADGENERRRFWSIMARIGGAGIGAEEQKAGEVVEEGWAKIQRMGQGVMMAGVGSGVAW
jgi:hypothetical protein